jgi:hypothetical protein
VGVFSRALVSMGASLSSEPQPFRSYAIEAGHPGVDTASCISVQTLRGLDAELRDAGVMVFRLGTRMGRHTEFGLARCVGDWGDYFFIDEEVFGNLGSPIRIGDDDAANLLVFRLLPKYTETSLVNLALASGVLSRALAIDEQGAPIVSATGQGTYSFEVCPHRAIERTWHHHRGQVEVDAAFIGNRRGTPTLFVVEAKLSDGLDSLAKSKLAYPMLALSDGVPSGMPIVGVYLRVVRRPGHFDFYVAEGLFADDRRDVASLTLRGVGRFEIESS